jgi:hypothetical protein
MLANSDLLRDLERRLNSIKLGLALSWHKITYADVLQRYNEFDLLGQTGDPSVASSLQREVENPNSASKKLHNAAAYEKNLKMSDDMAALAAPSALGTAVQLVAPIVAPATGVNLVGAVIAPWIAWADVAAKSKTLDTLHDIRKGLDPTEVGGAALKCTCEPLNKIIGWVPGFEDYQYEQQQAILKNACYQNVLYFIAKKEGSVTDRGLGFASLGSYALARLAYSAGKRLEQWSSGKAGDKEIHCRLLHTGARDKKCHLAMTMLHMICKEKKWHDQAASTLQQIINREIDWERSSDPTTKAEILRSVAVIVASDGWEQIKSCV